MLELKSHLGNVTFTKKFFETVIKDTLADSFGIVAPSAISAISGNAGGFLGKNIKVKIISGKLFIKAHVTTIYGANTAAVIRGVQNKIRWAIYEQTSVVPAKIDVYLDGIKF